MTLQDPILGMLPAPDNQIIAKFPRHNPDAILRRIRKAEETIRLSKIPEDRPELSEETRRAIGEARKRTIRRLRPKLPTGVRINPVNESQLKTRVCVCCGKEYTGIKKHFMTPRNKKCNTCRAKR